MEVKFYQILFLHLWRSSCGFGLFSFLWCSTSVGFRVLNHWTILVNLGWIPLGHNVWSFRCVVGFVFLIFSWESLPLFSSKILACNFLFWYCLCLVLVSGWWRLHKVTLGLFPPIYSLERVWERLVQVLSLFGRIGLWSHLILAFYSLGGGFLFFVCLVDSISLPSCDQFFQITSFLVQFCWAMFPQACPYLLGCPVCWHIIVHSFLSWFLYFCSDQLWFLLFHFFSF